MTYHINQKIISITCTQCLLLIPLYFLPTPYIPTHIPVHFKTWSTSPSSIWGFRSPALFRTELGLHHRPEYLGNRMKGTGRADAIQETYGKKWRPPRKVQFERDFWDFRWIQMVWEGSSQNLMLTSSYVSISCIVCQTCNQYFAAIPAKPTKYVFPLEEKSWKPPFTNLFVFHIFCSEGLLDRVLFGMYINTSSQPVWKPRDWNPTTRFG